MRRDYVYTVQTSDHRIIRGKITRADKREATICFLRWWVSVCTLKTFEHLKREFFFFTVERLFLIINNKKNSLATINFSQTDAARYARSKSNARRHLYACSIMISWCVSKIWERGAATAAQNKNGLMSKFFWIKNVLCCLIAAKNIIVKQMDCGLNHSHSFCGFFFVGMLIKINQERNYMI